jgi:thioredoxin-like negative regulator of GroEL
MSANYPLELPSQDFFESLLATHPSTKEHSPLVIIYFTARWCGACKRIDIASLMTERKDAIWYKCDVDDNTYTPGYCGIRSIPSFLAISLGKPLPVLSNSDPSAIKEWLNLLPTGK